MGRYFYRGLRIEGLRGKLAFILSLILAPLILNPSFVHALKYPHAAPNINLCSDCHSRTGAGFATITSQNILCINAIGCHNTGGRAERKALSVLDASNRFGSIPELPGAKHSSHGWKIPNSNPDAGVIKTDKWGELATGQGKVLNEKILCTRCHRAHGEKTGYVIHEKFLRQTPKGNYICMQCHSARQISNVRDEKPADKHYSHPVEVNYSTVRTSKPDWFHVKPLNSYSSNPSAALKLFTTVNVDSTGRVTGVKGTNQVVCQTCHGPMHSSDSNPYTFDNITTYARTGNYSTSEGNLLRRYPPKRSNDLCLSCHKVQTHRDFLCSRCHTPHKKAGENNRYLIHENISTPNSGRKAVLFTSTSHMARRWQDNSQPTPVCQVCHTQTKHHRNYSTSAADRSHNYLGNGDYKFCAAQCHKHTSKFSHGAGGTGKVEDCLPCHGHDPGYKFTYSLKNYSSQGTGNRITHSTHTENDADDRKGPNVFCDVCHDVNSMPYFRTGTDANGDGKFDLTETNVCDGCHSPGGTFNGVNSVNGSVGAKDNFKAVNGDYANGGVYNSDGSLKTGKEKWCVGCHDDVPATINGQTAPNKLGDNSTYGFFVTGHGKLSGNYGRLNHQESTATGNPAANRNCAECHDSQTQHIVSGINPVNSGNQYGKRLKYANDNSNALCKACHKTGGSADAAPKWFTTSEKFEKSAHGNNSSINPLTGQSILCTDCHDVHGPSGGYAAMTKKNKESLCYDCHTGGRVRNDAISGFGLASSIKQAFTSYGGHPLGQSFVHSGQNYNLQCTSCHNVHVVTGKYWDAASNKSPVSKFSNNTAVWGNRTGQKMNDYAGGGTYRTPSGDSFSGSQLPDYPSFCLDCHGQPDPAGWTDANRPDIPASNFGINWESDPHGRQSANNPNGYGTCPNWFACGKATGWDGDDCLGSQGEFGGSCWPVIPRGLGDELFTREAYTHKDRVAGANFTLSCTDCHEVHGSGIGSMIRPSPNGGGQGSTIWNNMCNNCHYYYSDWHAGMACANASCHEATSIHRMKKNTGSGTVRNVDNTRVLHYAFENGLGDSGDWLLSGQWYSGGPTGTFAAGKVGQAGVFNGSNTVQVGTTNAYWSTDEGYHGTWKYTEMKYNTTLEAWVNPTDTALTKSEYSIFTKHTGWNDGGYAFLLKNVNGTLRAAFYMKSDTNGSLQDGRSSIRGAYSSIAVPFNAWTHVAVTFDTAGPDRDSNDRSVGRIRIYVNGEDVTWSDTGGNMMQPGAGETSIFNYSENSPWNESICYNGTWCASEFSIGGFYGWQNTFIGMIDEAKVWNVTKNSAYFAAYDSQAGPYISTVDGVIGTSQLTVTFSEGVYTNTGSSGALTPSDFTLTDSQGRTITSVSHTAGSAVATLTLSAVTNDTNADTLAAGSNAIFDNYNNAVSTTAVTVYYPPACGVGQIVFNLNEASGSATVTDSQAVLSGQVYGGAATLTGSAYSGGGDSSGRYIHFTNNDTCLQASTAMTVEARIKPTGITTGATDYIRRIIDRTGGGNWQLSVWRDMGNANFTGYTPGDGVASILLWVNVVNANGGVTWKPVMTNYTNCPIQSNRWYKVKAVWNTSKAGGTTGQPFVPADIYVDDQGANGDDVGEAWSGYVNCTNSAQTYQTDNTRRLYTGDSIFVANGDFAIGANGLTPGTSTTQQFNGLIDWLTWQDAAQ